MRKPWLLFCALLMSAPVQAKTIRVLLHDDKPQLTFRCLGALKFKNAQGQLLNLPGLGRFATVGLSGGELKLGARPLPPTVFAACSENRIEVAGVPWRGRVALLAQGEKLVAVNHVDLEDYLLSVVPSEMPYQWPLEALKAQAVAARSYVLNSLGQFPGFPYDVTRGQEDQVYLGLSQEKPHTSQAVLATRGKVMWFGGKIIRAFFHSTSGGVTGESIGIWHENLPYTRPVASPGEQSKYNEWAFSVSHQELENALLNMGVAVRGVRALLPHTQDAGGRHLTFQVVDQYGAKTLTAFDLRRALGRSRMKSTLFSMDLVGREGKKVSLKAMEGYLHGQTQLEDIKTYVFHGRGWGHGVGMSQYGALALSQKGRGYQQILHHYYTGVNVVDLKTLGME